MRQFQRSLRRVGKAIGRFFHRVRKGSLLDIAILVCIVGLLIVGTGIAVFSSRMRPGNPRSSSQSLLPNEPVSSYSSPSLSASDSWEPDSSESQSETDEPSEYDGTVLSETPDGGQAYVDNTLFLGDSNTYRLASYNLTSWQNNLSAVGMGIQHVTSTPCMYFDGIRNAALVPNAVAMMQPQRIIMTYGTNNTLWSAETFIKQYKAATDAILDKWPYADMIINAVPPVAASRSGAEKEQRAINAFNKALKDFAKDEGYQFLDSTEALMDSATGYARKEYFTEDGLHLSEAGAKALIQYVRTHTHDAPDIRPALKDIPTHRPTPEATFNPPDTSSSDSSSGKGVEVRFFISQGKEGGALGGTLTQTVVPGQSCSAVTLTLSEGYTAQWGCTEGSVERGLSVSEDKRTYTLTFTVPPTELSSIDVWASLSYTAPPVSSEPAPSEPAPSEPTPSEPEPPASDVHVHVWGNWYDLGDGTHQGVCIQPGCPDVNIVSTPTPHEWGATAEDGTHTCTLCGATEPDSAWTLPSIQGSAIEVTPAPEG